MNIFGIKRENICVTLRRLERPLLFDIGEDAWASQQMFDDNILLITVIYYRIK